MRADVFSCQQRPVVKLLALALMALTLTACKTERDPDDPTILGVPPKQAYLGVDYYYNFGAYGGEGILDYSLTNAPAWLALEDTSNKARQGIIIHGIPGLTGGNRGEDDLGRTLNINLVTTDGRDAGVQPFEIEVKQNNLSLKADGYAEGKAGEVSQGAGVQCDLPPLTETGEHTYDINLYDDDGNLTGTESRTDPTYPVLVRVNLEQPSVTRVQVAFELQSSFDPDACDPSYTSPHQQCEHSRQNTGDAIISRDIIAWGSNSAGALPAPDYLTYTTDGNGLFTGGVITLEPGITECYVRLEVVDDDVPEPSESLELVLTEVRNGLAGLGSSSRGVRVPVIVDDNEPTVTLTTLGGGSRDVINVGGEEEYKATLNKAAEEVFYVRIGPEEASTAQPGIDYVPMVQDGTGNWIDGDVVTFAEGVTEARFRIRVADAYANTADNDNIIVLSADDRYQAGRENFARSDGSNLRIGINELSVSLMVGDESVFIPTDLVSGHDGRIFVAGYNPAATNQPEVHIYNQKGVLTQVLIADLTAPVAPVAPPVLQFTARQVKQGDKQVTRRELVLAYGTEGALAGSLNNGGVDEVVTLFYFDSANPAGYRTVWTHQSGTDGDDLPRWAATDSVGTVFVTGETSGQWPGSSARGGFDSYVQRIESLLDGNALTPQSAWVRQAGSAGDEHVVGGGASINSGLVVGNAGNSVEGEPVLGGADFFFYSASGADTALTIRQRGTEADDTLTAAIHSGGNYWMLGSGADRYFAVTEDGPNGTTVQTLGSEPLGSSAGFLVSYSNSGTLNSVLAINDGTGESDQLDEFYRDLMEFAGDIIIAGELDGHAALLRVGAPLEVTDGQGEGSDDPVIHWYAQGTTSGRVLAALANYRDDEIYGLLQTGSEGSRQWYLMLFSAEGRSLNGDL